MIATLNHQHEICDKSRNLLYRHNAFVFIFFEVKVNVWVGYKQALLFSVRVKVCKTGQTISRNAGLHTRRVSLGQSHVSAKELGDRRLPIGISDRGVKPLRSQKEKQDMEISPKVTDKSQ
jgi:hypothetical protein